MFKSKKNWLLAISVLAVAAFSIWFFAKPAQINLNLQPSSAQSSEQSDSLACPKSQQAFDVDALFVANVNNQNVFKSRAVFRLQLDIEGHQIKGLASNIRFFEQDNKEPKNIEDVKFLSSIDPALPLVYLDFDPLGLPQKHPMLVIGQLLKNLSVGVEDKEYHFNYDLMQGQYGYQQTQGKWQRHNLASNSQQDQLWELVMASECSIKSLYSKESRPLDFGPAKGSISYEISASAVNSFVDLANLSFKANANAHLGDVSAKLSAWELEKEVKTAKEMWAIIEGFEQDSNTARLQRAADFMVNSISTTELANHLAQNSLSEDEKRNLAFSLSLSSDDKANDYIIDTINSIPKNAGDQVDVQKIRLMVALAGRDIETREPYDNLVSISDSRSESNNVRNNALVSAAILANRLEEEGRSNVKQEFSARLQKNIEEDNPQAASSMLAANNAGIESLDNKIIPKLQSDNAKNRYAAATTLANREQNYDLLIKHMQTESDNLVNQVIVERIDSQKLSIQQRQRLENIAAQAKAKNQEYEKDKASLIELLLNR